MLAFDIHATLTVSCKAGLFAGGSPECEHSYE